jgi:hypothetical protein
MKYLKKYRNFTENVDTSSIASNNVVSPQPGLLPGKTGTEGSGDVAFVFKKSRRKKGDASEVSDLRDLEDVDTNKIDESKRSI